MHQPGLALAAAAMLVIHWPAWAQPSDPFACVDTGYSEAEQAEIDSYVAGFDLEVMDPGDAVSQAIARRAAECAAILSTGEQSLMPLLQYRFAGLLIEGIAAHQPDVVDTVRRIDTELDPSLRARFYRVFEAGALGRGESARPVGLSEQDEQFFIDTILDSPVNGSEDQAEGIGGYLAARVMQRDAREQMAALTPEG
jgi:hypothetical protein